MCSMENTSSPFIIMTWAIFCSVLHLLYYRHYINKCVVKYLRILFLYPEHTNTR